MELITVSIIGLALAMDAFAVSIASGTIYKKLKIKYALRIALFFGTFQERNTVFTSASRSSNSASTRAQATIAVTGLLIEAA